MNSFVSYYLGKLQYWLSLMPPLRKEYQRYTWYKKTMEEQYKSQPTWHETSITIDEINANSARARAIAILDPTTKKLLFKQGSK